MEDTEILNLWKTYDKRLEQSLLINKQNIEDITRLKVRSLLTSVTPLKIFTVLLGILWVGFLDVLIINLLHSASLFFLISAGIQSMLTTLAIGIYLYQLILISQSDIDKPILVMQKKTVSLKISSLWIDRILFLQLPVWTTFYWNKAMFENGSGFLIVIQIIVTVIFASAAIWLFFNIKFENRNKRWIRFIFSGKEWNTVVRAMQLLNEKME